MSASPFDLDGSLRSLGEVFALAHALEAEAAARYADLASDMHALGLPDVAAVFEHLVAEEKQHVAAVEAWSRATTGTPPDATLLRWPGLDSFDEAAARAIASSRLASAYRALSMAVRNEERAFLLWTRIAAGAADAQVRKAAEAMAMEELRHAAMLRRERRQAFHAARTAEPVPAHPAASVRDIETSLAAGLARLASGAAFAAWAPDLRRLATEAASMASVSGTPGAATDHDPPAAVEAVSLLGLRQLAERAAELYLAAADAAREEHDLLHQQALAGRAITRIARLGAMAEGN